MKRLEFFFKLLYLNTEDKILSKANDAVVELTFIFAPSSPTESTLNNIINENLIRLSRVIEVRRYDNFLESNELVKEVLNYKGEKEVESNERVREDI